MPLLIIAPFICIALLEAPRLIRMRMWRELAAFCGYLIAGAALCVPQLLGTKLPNPAKWIEALFRPLAHLLE